jgi:hypothetical protein
MAATTTRDEVVGLRSRIEIDVWKVVLVFFVGAAVGGCLGYVEGSFAGFHEGCSRCAESYKSRDR